MLPALFPAHQVQKEIIPYDGNAIYYGKVFENDIANNYFDILLNTIAWQHDEAKIFGKHYITARKVAWYALEPFEYRYSGIVKQAHAFNDILHTLKSKAEELTQEQYNSCLLNLYHTGDEGMAWHSDGEKELEADAAIASLSFGAERNFSFKHKQSGERVSVMLEHGSLLVMKGKTQSNWLHRLAPTKRIKTARINLTFRKMRSGI